MTTAELYDAYLEYAEEEGYPQLNRTAFGRALSAALRQTVTEAQPAKRVNGQEARGYLNISLL